MNSDSEDDRWEEVPLDIHTVTPTETDTVGQAEAEVDEEEVTSMGISFTVAAREKRKGITKADRELRANIHKAQFVCLLGHMRWINSLLDDYELQSILLSQLSADILFEFWNPAKISKKDARLVLIEKLERLIYFWNDNFVVQSDSKDSEISREGVLESASLLTGSRVVSCLLFVSCCRALSLGCRLVYSLTSISLSLSQPAKSTTKETPPDEPPTKKRRISAPKDENLHLVWSEILLPSDHAWIYVPIHDLKNLDKPESVEKRLKPKLSYILAAEQKSDRLKDVTRKYVQDLATATKKSRIDPWSSQVIDELCSKIEPFDRVADESEDAAIKRAQSQDSFPSTIGAFLNHPRYVLERHLKKYEVIHPKTTENVLGQIRGENIYSRDIVHTLHTKDKWLSLEGKMVRKDEEPLKFVKSRVVNKERGITRLGENEDETSEMVGLFGEWQTELFVPAPIVNGIIPKNKYNNIDLFKPSMLPPGTVHLVEEDLLSIAERSLNKLDFRMPSLKKVAKLIDVDYSEAVVGFEYRGGRSIPVVHGIVIARENEMPIREAYLKQLFSLMDKAREQKESDVVKRWGRLTHKAIIMYRLEKRYNS